MDNFEFTNEEIIIIKTVISKRFRYMVGQWYDDIYSIGMFATWEARNTYDPNRGTKYSTFLYNCVFSRIYAFKRKMYDSVDGSANYLAFSTDFRYESEAEEVDYQMLHLDEEYDFDFNIDLERFYKLLTPRQCFILTEQFKGSNQREIAKTVGVSMEAIRQQRVKIKEKYDKYMEVAV